MPREHVWPLTLSATMRGPTQEAALQEAEGGDGSEMPPIVDRLVDPAQG